RLHAQRPELLADDAQAVGIAVHREESRDLAPLYRRRDLGFPQVPAPERHDRGGLGGVGHAVDEGGEDLLGPAERARRGRARRIAVDLLAELRGVLDVGLDGVRAEEEVEEHGVPGIAAGLEEGPLGERGLVDLESYRGAGALRAAERLPLERRHLLAQSPQAAHEVVHRLVHTWALELAADLVEEGTALEGCGIHRTLQSTALGGFHCTRPIPGPKRRLARARRGCVGEGTDVNAHLAPTKGSSSESRYPRCCLIASLTSTKARGRKPYNRAAYTTTPNAVRRIKSAQ